MARPPRRAWIVAAILVVLVVIVIAKLAQRYEKYTTGLWVGDSSFLQKADLRDMQLFLGPAEGGKRQGYLIMAGTDGNLISNQAIEVCGGGQWSAAKQWLRAENDSCRSRVNITCDEQDLFPTQLNMAVSILNGTLTLYDDEKVYAFLVKDASASSAAVESYNLEADKEE